jgi:hypothetical protein
MDAGNMIPAHFGHAGRDNVFVERLWCALNAQALLGHKSPDMTALYRDVRGSEWIEIRPR